MPWGDMTSTQPARRAPAVILACTVGIPDTHTQMMPESRPATLMHNNNNNCVSRGGGGGAPLRAPQPPVPQPPRHAPPSAQR